MHRLKVKVMDPPCQVLRKPCLFFYECLVDQQLGSSIRQLHRLPLLDLLLQRTEVPLHPVDPNGQAVLQREVLGMLGEDSYEIPVKFEIFTYKDPELCAATDY